MTMMSSMNNFSRPTEGKFLSPDCAVEHPVLRKVIQKIPSGDGGWKRLRFTSSYSPEERELLTSLGVSPAQLETEDSYAVFGEGDVLTVCSANLRGQLYGAYTLLQQAYDNGGKIPGGVIFNVPQCSFRGLKIYLPAPDALEEFYRTVDFLLYYRCNTVIIEVGGAMEYRRHPEINESWLDYCREMGRYPERAREVQEMFGWAKNSIHFENGGGRYLPQDTIRKLVQYCRDRGMEVIPEVPSLSHADYLLNAHQELAERPYDPFPDVYCPSNPESYRLLFDVLDEVLEVFQPETVHIGHDECYSLGLCERCRDKDPAELYAGDITRIHDYLAARGVRTMFWSEKVLNAVTKSGQPFGGAEQTWNCSRNTSCHIAAAYSAIDRIPRDCRAHNWYWGIVEWGDREFHQRGIPMTFGNWSPLTIRNWQARVDAGAQGGAPSHWTTLSEETLQYDGVFTEIVFGAFLQWIPGYTPDRYAALLEETARELFLYKNREVLGKPHFSITHRTTLNRPWEYLTSAPLLREQNTIGSYLVEYQSGRTLEIPLIYGRNIGNPFRSWQLREDPDFDCYRCDCALCGMTLTTLPLRQKNGETHYRVAVENPFPGDPVTGIRIRKTAADPGEILLTSFSAEEQAPAFDSDAVFMPLHY